MYDQSLPLDAAKQMVKISCSVLQPVYNSNYYNSQLAFPFPVFIDYDIIYLFLPSPLAKILIRPLAAEIKKVSKTKINTQDATQLNLVNKMCLPTPLPCCRVVCVIDLSCSFPLSMTVKHYSTVRLL